MLAASLRFHTGKEVVFNLATRDMNKLALQSHLLGAQRLGLENVMVLKGDSFTARDLSQVKEVGDFTSTGLIKAVDSMNQGTDFRGSQLRAPTELCIGASIDLGRGIETEARLTYRKASAGVHFFLTQPVFSTGEIGEFLAAYSAISGGEISQPIFYGLQVLKKDGIIFSSVPEGIRQELENGRGRCGYSPGAPPSVPGLRHQKDIPGPPDPTGWSQRYEASQRVLETAKLA